MNNKNMQLKSRRCKKDIAKTIAGAWHSSQSSALYQFASSGIYMIENHLRYLQEIEYALHPEYNLYPRELTKIQREQLEKLKDYLIQEGTKNGLNTTWGIHPKYGYNIPYIDENTPREIFEKIYCISYPL